MITSTEADENTTKIHVMHIGAESPARFIIHNSLVSSECTALSRENFRRGIQAWSIIYILECFGRVPYEFVYICTV